MPGDSQADRDIIWLTGGEIDRQADRYAGIQAGTQGAR